MAGLPSLSHFKHLRARELAFELELELEAQLIDEANEHHFDELHFPRASLFLPHLCCGASLISLRIDFCVFSALEAEELCQLLPHLRELSMLEVGWPSLHPLRHLTQLSDLVLHIAQHSSFSFATEHLLALASLVTLKLEPTHADSIDAATVAALQPPSALLPKLVRFEYSSSQP